MLKHSNEFDLEYVHFTQTFSAITTHSFKYALNGRKTVPFLFPGTHSRKREAPTSVLILVLVTRMIEMERFGEALRDHMITQYSLLAIV